MANQEHLAILEKGVEAWNEWQSDWRNAPDLSGADLTGTDLSGFNFLVSDFKRAVLRRCDLAGASFSSSDLGGADLTDANIYCTSFGRTVFQEGRTAGGSDITR